MRNLEQTRAGQALKFWSSDAVRQIPEPVRISVSHTLPALVLNNGLLAVVAYARSQGGLWELMLKEVAVFLSPGRLGILPVAANNLEGLINVLTHDKSDSVLLQRATSETVTFLGYLQRFARLPKE